MLKSYFKLAIRNAKRHKGYAAINLAGLVIGLACCMMIILYLQHELSVDRFHEHADRTYRITATMHMGGGDIPIATPGPLGPALVQMLPGVKAAARIHCAKEPLIVQRGNARFTEEGTCFADPGLFTVFDFPLRTSNAETALADPYQLLLSPTLARKYFGEQNPIGETLTLNGEHTYTISGVLASPQSKSHLQLNLVASFATLEILDPVVATWAEGGANPYVVLAPDYSPAALQAHLDDHLNEYMGYFAQDLSVHLEHLPGIYLHSTWPPGFAEVRGNRAYLYLFSTVAMLILLVACLNYMNLATARALRRAREVGVRKAIGASKSQLVRQFLSESLLLSGLAFVLALALSWLLVPPLGDLLGCPLKSHHLLDTWLLLVFLGMSVLVGLAAGSYPAFYLSAFDPVVVLKGKTQAGHRGGWLRKGMVVAQFTVSIGLAASTVVLWNQLDYMRTTRLGFDKEQVVLITPHDAVRPQYVSIKQAMLRVPGVQHITTAPMPGWTHIPVVSVKPEGIAAEPRHRSWIPSYNVDHDFLETLGVELVAGRNFDMDRPGDLNGSILINETLARQLGWTEPLGKTITLPLGTTTPPQWIPMEIIGVVQDFHFASMQRTVDPLFIQLTDSMGRFGKIIVKLKSENVPGTLKQLEATWATFSPDHPFIYSFLDEEIDAFYRTDLRLGRLLNVFSLLAIAIACLGLFGLAALMTTQRTKEIGIRKVLGASVSGLVALLSREHVVLVGLAFIIAAPVSYLIMHRWLEAFAYAVDLNWLTFGFIGLSALLLALLTVSYQAIKAALADPVKSLRYE